MIKNKDDLKYYIECDMKALSCSSLGIGARITSLYVPSIWKFQMILRKTEYLYNNRKKALDKLIFKLYYLRMIRYGYKLGFSIPLNVIGPGLCLCHAGTIIINPNAKIGANARIHANVNIGNSSKFGESWVCDNTPVIGDNVYIGPGAKIFGKINIGDNVAIGANAVVNKDVPDHVTVAGIPAKVINENGSEGMIIYGTKSVDNVKC